MLANHNERIINKLAKNMMRTNRRQFVILFVTVALSAFMMFSVFTVGLTYLDLSRLQNTRLYGAEYDIAVINGFSDRQKEIMERNESVRTVGVQAYAGYVKSTDADDTVNAGLLWGDRKFWESQKAPARTGMEGRYPQTAEELLATKKVLEECGKGSLTVGDHLVMTYEDNTGIYTKEFVISGIWSGYGTDQTNFYVSEDFYNRSGYRLQSDGILYIKLKNDYVTGSTIEKMEESLNLSNRQVFQPSDYIERSLTILAAVCGLCLMICFSAYLLIYNILYLSVSGKIRYYGLLQTLGMTKKQLVRFIRKQMLTAGSAGIFAGIGSGAAVSLFLIPHMMKILGISLGNTGIHFYPAVLLLSVWITGAAFLCGIRKPIRIATDIMPVEAAKYRGNQEAAYACKKKRMRKSSAGSQNGREMEQNFAGGRVQKKKGSLYWRMAKDQLGKDRKKTMIVFLSLAASFIVFYCMTTMVGSQGRRTVYPLWPDADLVVQNSTQTTEDIASLQPAVSEEMMSDLKKTEGITQIYTVRGVPVVFPYGADGFSDFWIKGYTELKPYLSYSETVSDYRKNPEKYYGMIKGIGEAEFEYLNDSLGNTIEKQDFLDGKTAVVQYAGFEIPKEQIGSTVSFKAGNEMQKITIGAVSYEGYYGASANSGANLIVSERYLETLAEEPYILSLSVKYEQSYEEDTENRVKELFQNSPYANDLICISKYEEMKTIQDSQAGMFETGTVIALLLLAVGMFNYINTMSCSMQNRKLTFSIMESVGMSEKQVRKLLIREGFLYAAGAVFITLTAGTVITYIVFQSMNYMKIPFAVPVLPLVCAAVLILGICVFVPVAAYQKTAGGRSVVERLREYE